MTTTAPAGRRFGALRDFGRLPRVMRLLVLTQLAFNIGFYMVLPYLATHLTENLALAGAVVGLVLGLRTFSQQGLFVVGGTLTDRIGAKPVVLAGCALRAAGFVLLGIAESLPAVLAGAMLTGFAAALFSPAVESSLAREAGEQAEAGGPARADVFAMLAISGQVGTVVGPLLGASLLAVGFRLSCLVAAVVFVLIGLAHLRWLPRRPPQHAGERVLAGWAEVVRNRRFMAFAAGYSGYLLCYNQLYLALPAELRRATGDQAALGWLFVLASVMVIAGQLPATRWGRRIGAARAIVLGFGLMALSFLTVAIAVLLPGSTAGVPLWPAVTMVVLLTAGEMLAVPVAQDLVPRLAGERRLGVYFGVLSSAGGVAVLAGSTVVGALLDPAVAAPAVPWLVLAGVPAASAVIISMLARRGSLTASP
ncbi:putative MFS family arabinose efflux permease [Pseudonocardia hierapolitana]|uniref:Putative MFS family arabinose efflux permease n=1 Tax=Pseudonocardia hierapolitana TaxID=1128676 RepID=A0A561SS39_9PSEU|nr:MFS transporter [Pseudonocardia hierapolitana]TWF77680.1 putative MFS family arabinose efflux permease [Pseudonocardia hierapolitana]